MPQQKKHSSTRRRRNAASTATVLRSVSPADLPPTPKLPAKRIDPETGKEIRWKQITRDWWNELWAAPMSSEYHASDVYQLYILADLYDRFWRKPSVTLATEIRMQRALFGMTPYDRRRLEWSIEFAEHAKARGDKRRAGHVNPAPEEPSEDPRADMA